MGINLNVTEEPKDEPVPVKVGLKPQETDSDSPVGVSMNVVEEAKLEEPKSEIELSPEPDIAAINSD